MFKHTCPDCKEGFHFHEHLRTHAFYAHQLILLPEPADEHAEGKKVYEFHMEKHKHTSWYQEGVVKTMRELYEAQGTTAALHDLRLILDRKDLNAPSREMMENIEQTIIVLISARDRLLLELSISSSLALKHGNRIRELENKLAELRNKQ